MGPASEWNRWKRSETEDYCRNLNEKGGNIQSGEAGGIAEVWETVRRRELTESERGILCPKGRELKIVYTILRKVCTFVL